MRLLELFCGTKSVGKVFEAAGGWEVTSVDLNPKCEPTICCSVLDIELDRWPPGYFDFVWASPPCTLYSRARTRGPVIDMTEANHISLHTVNLIKSLKPRFWAIENPFTSRIWKLPCMDLPFTVGSYCHYSDWGYRKDTRFATNIERWKPRRCHHDCLNLDAGSLRPRHRASAQKGPSRAGDCSYTRNELYRIPGPLVEEMLARVEETIAADEVAI